MESDLLTAQTLKVASVILDTALDKPLDYLIPQTHWGKLQSGMRVRVPLQKTVRLATVLEIKAESSFHPLQPIHEILTDKLLIYPDLMALVRWIAHYYCTPLHKVLRYALPPAIRKMLKPKEQLFIQSTLCFFSSSKAYFPLRAL